MSKEVKLEGSYDYLFGYLSNFIHSNTLSAGDYILGKDKNGVVIEIGTSEASIKAVLPTAVALFLEMAEIISEEYSLGFDEKINEIKNNIKLVKKINICLQKN